MHRILKQSQRLTSEAAQLLIRSEKLENTMKFTIITLHGHSSTSATRDQVVVDVALQEDFSEREGLEQLEAT